MPERVIYKVAEGGPEDAAAELELLEEPEKSLMLWLLDLMVLQIKTTEYIYIYRRSLKMCSLSIFYNLCNNLYIFYFPQLHFVFLV